MELRIFTLPFDETTEGFPDEIITQFCMNKKVHSVQTQFFLKNNNPSSSPTCVALIVTTTTHLTGTTT